MVKVELLHSKDLENYIKVKKPKELKIRLSYDGKSVTAKFLADNDVIAQHIISAKFTDFQIVRMRIGEGKKFPFMLESFEVNTGLWKGKFKRIE